MLQRARANPSVGLFDLDRFDSEVWDGVAVSRRTPMQEYVWTQAAANALSPGRPVQVMTVGNPTAPLALAPLITPARGRSRLLGAEELGEPVEVIYRDEVALEHLVNGLASCGRPISFGHYPADGTFIDLLTTAYNRRGTVVSKPLPKRAAPFIELDDTWLEPEQNFTSRRRSDFRRMQRKAAGLGCVTFDILTPSPDEVDSLVDKAVAVEAKSWKAASGTAIAMNPEQNRFYRIYARAAAAAGILRISFMHFDGVAAAMQIAVETNERFWLLKIGYDDALKGCSPGNLLLRETIAHAAARNLKSFEFLGKEADWTKVWTSAARPITALRTYPYNFAGVHAMSGDAVHAAVPRINKAVEAFGRRRRTVDA